MSAVTSTPPGGNGLVDRIYKKLTDVPTWAMWLLVTIWTIPNLSLLVNSVRGRDAQRNDAFWNILAERDDAGAG